MEKEGKTVSIIVPVYQVREYLDVCVQSVLAQTYTDLEIILVDDGSTDGSEKICDRYAETDERVRVVHQKNKGLSGARNEGLKLAKGEYIAFVDADDKVSPFFIELLYELAEKYHARIAVCSYEKGRELSGKIKRKKAYVVGSDKMLREWHGKRKNWKLSFGINCIIEVFLRWKREMYFRKGNCMKMCMSAICLCKEREEWPLPEKNFTYTGQEPEVLKKALLRKNGWIRI